MNLSLINKQQRRQVWADMVMRCRNSGLTITDWCQAEGISLATYHYRQRQVMDLVSEQGFRSATEFVQLPLAPIDQPVVTSCITIHMGKVSIAVEAGVDATTLATVLASIDRLC